MDTSQRGLLQFQVTIDTTLGFQKKERLNEVQARSG